MRFFKSILRTIKIIYLDKDFSFLALLLALLLLPLSINLSGFALLVAIVLRLIQVFFLKQKVFRTKFLKYSSFIALFFLFYIVLNSIIQNTFYYSISIFENEFSHFFLLILAPMLLRKKHDNTLLCYFLFFGLIIACLYVFVMSFVLNFAFNKEAFLSILDIHHTYLSIYILFFVNVILATYFNKKQVQNNYKKFLFPFIVVISFIVLFILDSKVSMVIFAVLLVGHLLATFSKKNTLIYLVILFVLIVALFLFNKNINTSYINALDFRLEIWQESLNSIKEQPFFGNLKIQENDLLNLKHYLNGKYYLMDSSLNSHNQYLSIFLKYGIIGFLILMVYPLNLITALNKTASKSDVKAFIGFCLIVLVTFFIENVLDRHHGIVFCAIFYNYYLVAIQNENI